MYAQNPSEIREEINIGIEAQNEEQKNRRNTNIGPLEQKSERNQPLEGSQEMNMQQQQMHCQTTANFAYHDQASATPQPYAALPIPLLAVNPSLCSKKVLHTTPIYCPQQYMN